MADAERRRSGHASRLGSAGGYDMDRRTFLQSVIAVPLVAVGMPRVNSSGLLWTKANLRAARVATRTPFEVVDCIDDLRAGQAIRELKRMTTDEAFCAARRPRFEAALRRAMPA